MPAAGASHSRQDHATPADPSALNKALYLHRAGKLPEAEAAYQNILAEIPEHADALHLLGMLLQNQNQIEQAEGLIRQAIAIQPNHAVYHSNLGVVLAGAEKFDEAIVAYRHALCLSPSSPETLNNLGVALHAIGSSSAAVDCFKRAFVLRPGYEEAHSNLLRALQLNPHSAAGQHTLGDFLFEQDQPVDAIQFYEKALAINPHSAETHNNLGNAQFAAGELIKAVGSYELAIQISENFPQAWNNFANGLRELGDLENAVIAYQRAIALQPQLADPLSNLGNVFQELCQWESAIQCYEKALAITPDHPATLNHIGNLHAVRGEWLAAVDAYHRAIAAKPHYADAINNLGTALEELGNHQQAMTCYRQAFALDPKSVSPPWNIALLQLLSGEYEQGWSGYENRWRQKKHSKTWRNFDQPVLIRLPIPQATTVLIHAEQGFGDAIQFVRYAPMLASAGARVLLECPALLVRLFSSLPGITQIISQGDPLPNFDLHCPMMSLPKIFGTTLQSIPSSPYLQPLGVNLSRWKLPVFQEGRNPCLRVGLVWAGQATHQKDRHRSLTLAAFSKLGSLPDIQFFSLQIGEQAIQAKTPPPGMTLIDWTREIHDFADTAALISQLDLVISVDTAVCHLAGAIGKPVWILLAYQPDWRWLLARTDSPWYPSARLFRQTQPDDWKAPLDQLAAALRDYSKSSCNL